VEINNGQSRDAVNIEHRKHAHSLESNLWLALLFINMSRRGRYEKTSLRYICEWLCVPANEGVDW